MSIAKLARRLAKALKHYWQKNWLNKSMIIAFVTFVVLVSAMFGIAQWYKTSENHKPLVMGVSFMPAYAEFLGLDAEQTMDKIIGELGVRHFRLVSYWNQIEPAPGEYDFEALDWQFKKVEQVDGTVTLSLGLRQPRWPECHMPNWAEKLPKDERQIHLNGFIAAVVDRYKDSPALKSYQLENEFLLTSFAPHCPEITPEQVTEEFKLVKFIDPQHPIIISRSNNLPAIPLRQPVPDEYGISVYRRVWEGRFIDRYFQYPFPAWYYGFLAGAQKIVHGKPSVLHELQAEAWPPHGQSIPDTSLDEQNKSINAQRLEDTFEFGRDTGMREIYLWGAEYWYYRMVKLDDPSLWQVAKDSFK